MTGPSRADAERLDAADPLADFPQRFVIADPDLVYVDGNSLGRLPRATPERLQRLLHDEWGRGLIRSWEAWIDLAGAIGDRIALGVIGARPGEVIVGDSTTVNLFKALSAALDARPDRTVVVTDAGNFPTDRYVIESLASARRLEVRVVAADPTPDDIAAAVAGGGVAVVCLSLVAYRSGARLDGPAITEVAHATGALVVWDLSHAAGAIPVDLEAMGADLAVGCTYKYLNGGPGAPAFLYVRRSLQADLRQPIWGWFGAADQFAMAEEYRAADGIDRFQVGTPPVLGLAAVDEGVAVTVEAGMDAIDEKRSALMALALACVDGALTPLGVEVATPRSEARQGSHLSLSHPDAWRVTQALIAEHNVIPDFRPPDLVRIGLTPLYTAFVDVWRTIDAFRQVVVDRRYESYAAERPRVT